MESCREMLSEFLEKHHCKFIPDDYSPKKINVKSGKHLTDIYLAELAERHQMKLATFDTRISHRAVELIG